MKFRLVAISILIGVMAAAAAGAASASVKELRAKYEDQTFYLGTNVWHEREGAISWINFIATGDFIPVGTQVKVTEVAKEEIFFEAAGLNLKFKLVLEDALEPFEKILERVFVAAAPSLEGLSAADLAGVKAGKVNEGMSRRAVFLAVGYPPYSYTPPFKKEGAVNHDLEADSLSYMKNRFDMITYMFKDNVVAKIVD